MKHLLSSYKEFESNSNVINTKGIKSDLIDMLSYLSDESFNVQVEEEEHHNYDVAIEITISQFNGKGDFHYWDNRHLSKLIPFKFSDIKDDLIRVMKYMTNEDWSKFDFGILTKEKCINSNKVSNSNFYKTSILLYKDNICIPYTNSNYRTMYDKFVNDDQEIFCAFIGFGKSHHSRYC
jgi:hypothetical protein